MVSCPSCDASIDVEEEELDEGEVISCDECGASLKVISLGPLELQADGTDAEDADDFDFDDEDEDEDEEDEEEAEEDWH